MGKTKKGYVVILDYGNDFFYGREQNGESLPQTAKDSPTLEHCQVFRTREEAEADRFSRECDSGIDGWKVVAYAQALKLAKAANA